MNTTTAQPANPANGNDLYAKWRKIVEKELQGAPFEKKLVTGLVEGIKVQPLYGPHHQPADLSTASRRGLERPQAGVWSVAQVYEAETPAGLNGAWLDSLNKGQNALAVEGCGGLSTAAAWTAALNKISVEAVPLFVSTRVHVAPMAAVVLAALKAKKVSLADLTGSLAGDPFASWLEHGALPVKLEKLWDERATWTQWAKANAPRLATLEIDASVVAEAGGHAVQELAYALAAARETLSALAERQVPLADVAARIRTVFSSGPDFFVEVAKLRAWRELWSQLLAGYGLKGVYPRVHARTAKWNKSSLDLETNLLRTTTEALSAVVGGVESLDIGRYDEVSPKAGEVSQRLARNLHTLLGEEFQVGGPVDPVGGSWYVEELTTETASRAWALFQSIEGKGGLVASLKAGEFQAAVLATAKERGDAADKRRTIWIGVNQFPNLKDKPVALVHGDHAAHGFPPASGAALTRFDDVLKAAEGGSSIAELASRIRVGETADAAVQPLPTFRVAAGYEALRARVAALTAKGLRPKVFLAKIGPALQHKARADFSTGFFATGGFEILGKESFATAAEAAQAALKSGAKIAVLCSTDDTYPALVPEFAAGLKQGGTPPIFILAGYPTEHVEAFKQQGVNDFIHIRASVRGMLETLLSKLEA